MFNGGGGGVWGVGCVRGRTRIFFNMCAIERFHCRGKLQGNQFYWWKFQVSHPLLLCRNPWRSISFFIHIPLNMHTFIFRSHSTQICIYNHLPFPFHSVYILNTSVCYDYTGRRRVWNHVHTSSGSLETTQMYTLVVHIHWLVQVCPLVTSIIYRRPAH